MSLAQALLPEFDREMAGVRKTLERVPDDKLDYRPHPKSTVMGRLAGHLAELPRLVNRALAAESFDFAPPGSAPRQPFVVTSAAQALEVFDGNVKEAREALAAASDEQLQQPWTLLFGGKKVFTMPRSAVIRSTVLSHSIHHRAQLGVYLRMNDVPVPSLYGPSADERSF